MELPLGGERPKSAWDWTYKVAVVLLAVALWGGTLWCKNTFVSKEDHDRERAADKVEYENDKKETAARQAIVMAQNQEILLGINEVKVRMETNVRRDQDVATLQKQYNDLQQYVYTTTRRPVRCGVIMLYLRAVLVIGLLVLLVNRQDAYHHEDVQQRLETARFHREAVEGRKLILAMEKHNEEMIFNFEIRTVDRWKWLEDHNSGLKVPTVREPIDPLFSTPGILTAP